MESPARPPAASAEPAGVTPAQSAPPARIASLDVVRGAVMVLMAIDHVRVFAGVPAGGPTPGVFFTRWITHFCAPAFVFLAGTGAFLHGEKLGGRIAGRGALSRFLLVRGAWLIVMELTVVRLGWTFNLDYAHSVLAGVIWVIGWSMIALAALVWLPVAACGVFGLVMIAGHNLLDGSVPEWNRTIPPGPWRSLMQTLYLGGVVPLGDRGARLGVLYSLVPWVGVMAAGYAFGPVMRMAPERRRRICFAIGGAAVAAFLALRATNLYGDPRPWGAPQSAIPAALSFLNTTKYPASLLFLLMTLGPTIAILPLLERARGKVANVLSVFGRVPFFYYVLHVPLIHLVFVGLSVARFGEVIPWMTANHPMMTPPAPPGYAYGLLSLYAVTALVVALLYPPCSWFAALKRRRRDAWLSFL